MEKNIKIADKPTLDEVKALLDGTNDTALLVQIKQLIEDTKKSVSDGKSALASAITAKGVSTASDGTFAQLASAIKNITTLSSGSADATAAADKILSGYTAYAKGAKVTGSIASQGAQTITPGTSNKTIAAGKYLSGAQTIKGDANLVAGNIVQGTSIFGINGTAQKYQYVNKDTGTAMGYINQTKEIKTCKFIPYTFQFSTPGGHYTCNCADSSWTDNVPLFLVPESGVTINQFLGVIGVYLKLTSSTGKTWATQPFKFYYDDSTKNRSFTVYSGTQKVTGEGKLTMLQSTSGNGEYASFAVDHLTCLYY